MSTPLRSLAGIGPGKARQLARLELRSVNDLLLHRPHRYEDRRELRKALGLKEGESALLCGRVMASGVKRVGRPAKSVFELVIEDETGRLHCRFWNQPFLQGKYPVGEIVWAFGKVSSGRPLSMDQPEVEVQEGELPPCLHLNRLVPIYPLTGGISQRWLRARIADVLEWALEAVAEPYPEIPLDHWLSRQEAIRALHWPETPEETDRARQRLALDELLELQVGLRKRKERFRVQAQGSGLVCDGDRRLVRGLVQRIGFKLTESQKEVLREIRQDLKSGLPMRRLLQGDVGSGKTVVAACAAAMVLESGYSVAMLAPTEVLAEQHHQTFRAWLAALGVPVQLLTHWHRPSSDPPYLGITIGTHALLQGEGLLDRPGLVVIDEQHKFGVAQREAFLRQGHYPHLLVMTATPIPRTLALTLHGDLEVSVLRQLPKGRGAVRTLVRSPRRLPQIWEFIRQKLSEGRQAYVVHPRIEESGAGDRKTIAEAAETLGEILSPHRVAVLHGGLKGTEKEAVMRDFSAGRVQALVTTTVIEVGVDIPNASLMVIEEADRFGLAQLHQLRGRIGRGADKSYCILIGRLENDGARTRLEAVARHHDGFEIAEMDLRLRGPGELLGQTQSGLPRFRFADLSRDAPLLEQAGELVARYYQVGADERST